MPDWHYLGRIAAAALAATAFAFAAADPVLAAEHVVEISGYQYRPAVLRIKAGDTVRWVNREKRTSHSILFKNENPVFESERLFPDESWARRFDTPGKIPYTCGPHPEMHGLLEVAD